MYVLFYFISNLILIVTIVAYLILFDFDQALFLLLINLLLDKTYKEFLAFLLKSKYLNEYVIFYEKCLI